jgi:hypothetical protein
MSGDGTEQEESAASNLTDIDETVSDESMIDGSMTDETAGDETVVDEAMSALDDARRRLGEVPAATVVANHVMGLYELAAIHLSGTPPRLGDAALAIDAVGCLVEGLGDRLGPDVATLTEALSSIRLAFVQIKGTSPG